MWRNKLIAIFLLLHANDVLAQFGNEWIDFAQPYYKVKIVNDDFYRITGSELQAAGFLISSVPALKIQLFRRGQEVAINVSANGDGTLDYLEFYGLGNDGAGDVPLYDFGDQPHSFYNLFSDTAAYFITYKPGNENGKRMAFSSGRDASGLTPEAYHLEQSLQLFTNNYSTGIKFGFEASFSLSKYHDGEGWTGNFQRKNSFKDFAFTLTNRIPGTNPAFETVLIGGNSQNHNARISAGSDIGSLGRVANTQFTGWVNHSFNTVIAETNISGTDRLIVRILAEGFPGISERFSVAYTNIIFRQKTSVGAGENKLFTLDNPSMANAWLQISTTNATGTDIYDVTDPIDPIRLATTNFPDRVEVVVPDAINNHKVFAVTNASSVPSIEQVTMNSTSLSSKDYLIITHKKLQSSGDPVNDYKMYRESATGGGYEVAVFNFSELVNLYNYGDPSPLAIRNYLRYASTQTTPEYVFIIGKGFTPNHGYFRGTQSSVNVPTFGLPGSDMMYSLGIGADSDLPGIPVGRLNAFNPGDVTAYLNKIKEMESLAFTELWRKDFIQLSGGLRPSELQLFASIIQDLTGVLENDFIGGRAFNSGKETNKSVEFVDVVDRVNQGVGYITFFGHSSGTVTDIEIGRVSQPQFGFSNTGKYPVFLVNGCKAGEIFGNNFTFGEDWIITPDLGAIGFIAHADFATPTTLKRWSDLFYQLGFGDDTFVGESIGNVMLEVSKRYLATYGNSNSSLAQIQQMLCEGDPAYRIFGADHPDYAIDNNAVRAVPIQGEQILAAHNSFNLEIVVKNFGRSVLDPLVVQIDHTLPDGGQLSYVDQFVRPLRQDTLTFIIPNDPTRNNEGTNLLTVKLDPQNSQMELSKTNNTATVEVLIFRGNTTNLFPIDNGTVPDNQVEFIWQSSNLLENTRSYDLEFDTVAAFDSPVRRFSVLSGELLLRSTFDFSSLNFPDGTTVYWRTRFTNPDSDETGEWVRSSFTIIENIAEGWGQYEVDQVVSSNITGVEFNTGNKLWEFVQSTTSIDLLTFGANHPTFQYGDLKAIIGGINLFITSNTIDPVCAGNTINAIVFDKESGDTYRPVNTSRGDVFNSEVCGRLPQRIYNFTETNVTGPEARLEFLISQMRRGDRILLFSIGSVAYSNWGRGVINALVSVGIRSSTISSLTDGQAVIFLGRKDGVEGTATEIINDGSSTPVPEQSISILDNVAGSFTSGSFTSRKIGPALNWDKFSYSIAEGVGDVHSIALSGVNQTGEFTTLISGSRAGSMDISSIDAATFPQLKVELSFSDMTDQTPPQLNLWEITYSYPPEGLLFTTDKSLSSTWEGVEIRRPFSFLNYSNLNFSDSLDATVSLISQSTGNRTVRSFRIAPPAKGDTTDFEAVFPSLGHNGLNSLIVNVAANENEAYTENNRLTLVNLIEVMPDQTNPILDVTFDGHHILDGDIVSPNPVISIRLRDDNPFLFKKNTTGINISMRLPGEESKFQKINLSGPGVNFTFADEAQDFEVDYRPGPLENGTYGLRAQAEDQSGNAAGTEPFEITFEVINEASVTHFYPYPNPFSTSCRFVFTLTGSMIPDQIKIQIMTISGRVVREIAQDEIGPVKIGNNITRYAWDGRDEFGDILANGVYFYRVILNSNGEALQHRATGADRAFKHGFSKLYILR